MTPNNSLRQTITDAVKGKFTPHELTDDGVQPVKWTKNHWGYHLILDCSDCNENIDDETQIESFLKDLVKNLKMKALKPPEIVRVDSNEEGRGISAIQLITTSTITAHFDDQGNNAYIDVFSCKQYDPKIAVGIIQSYFEPKKIGSFWLFRDAGNTDPK